MNKKKRNKISHNRMPIHIMEYKEVSQWWEYIEANIWAINFGEFFKK